ncbi:dnaq: exonuclease, DNA polymerase III, epsilon subunit family [Gaiella occulta]|uniref:Dnaq: exonuclease, DNA polymerase III, epsilon subunit family n=1 Tax=Gaiella occulta TaxID=1002870 RepID=A0A7M2Z160_9ACTN|nr:exonuclease domain-containing protein [Gaiella occulta]RDI76030.1 dnaq: exonuclease, DNA polymerase III, epsilon subunit family [Gaiella occulta]
MQLRFDAADTLVDLIAARGGPVPAVEAARALFALASAPAAIARSLLDEIVVGDARLAWHGAAVGAALPASSDVPLERASFVVFDLETTGLSAATCRIVEIGAQRVVALEAGATFETLVDPGASLPPAISALTGIGAAELRGAPGPDLALRRFLAFAGDAVLVAHNARFDMAFLDRAVERLTGRRVAAPVVDTVWLARRLLGARTRRFGLGALARFFGTSVEPCHRALADACATAEILLALVGLAQERGARTVADLVELSAPRARRLHSRRALVAAAPTTPGVYVFRDKHGQALYVGRARNLRARLRSYFSGDRQRPAVEAALGAVERIDWHEHGSELEAALEELRLLRALRPPANARSTRPDRHVYLRRRGGGWVCGGERTAYGPIASRSLARRAARALAGFAGDDLGAALPPLRARLLRLAREQRYEDAARLRDRIDALEQVACAVAELERLRGLRICILAPAREPGLVRAFFVAAGRVVDSRALPPGGGAALEIAAGLAAADAAVPSLAPEDADELLLVAATLRRRPPELRVVPLDAASIRSAVQGVAFAA